MTNRYHKLSLSPTRELSMYSSVDLAEHIHSFGEELLWISTLPFERNSVRRQLYTLCKKILSEITSVLEDTSYATQIQRFQIRQHILAILCMQLQVSIIGTASPDGYAISDACISLLSPKFFDYEEILQMQSQVGKYHRDVQSVHTEYGIYNNASGATAKRVIRQLPIAGLRKNLENYTFQGDVLINVEAGTLYITFYSRADYVRFVGKQDEQHCSSVGTYFPESIGRNSTGFIVAIDGAAEFSTATKVHERTHRYEAFLHRDNQRSIFATAQTEIIAYMSENTSQEQIARFLGLRKNGYFPNSEELKVANISPKEYRKCVKQFIQVAFEMRDMYPYTYLHLLAVTRISSWKFLLSK